MLSSVSASPHAKNSHAPWVPSSRLNTKPANAGKMAPSAMEMISVRRWDDKPIAAGTYLPESITVYITICDDSYKQ